MKLRPRFEWSGADCRPGRVALRIDGGKKVAFIDERGVGLLRHYRLGLVDHAPYWTSGSQTGLMELAEVLLAPEGAMLVDRPSGRWVQMIAPQRDGLHDDEVPMVRVVAGDKEMAVLATDLRVMKNG